SLDYAFSSIVTENNILASRAVSSFHKLDENISNLFSLFKPHKIMSADSVYATSDLKTRHLYLKLIAKLSDEINMRETAFAERLLALSVKTKTDPGILLFRYPAAVKRYALKEVVTPLETPQKEAVRERVFYGLFTGLLAAGAAFAAFAAVRYTYFGVAASVFIGTFAAACAAVALSPAIRELAVKIMSAFLPPRPVLSRDLSSVPEEGKTLVLISEYIASVRQLEDAVRRVKAMRAVNDDANVTFALLTDLPPQNEERSELYRNIFDAHKRLLTEERTPNAKVIGIMRKPCRCAESPGYGRKPRAVKKDADLLASDGAELKFTARERKRGAIEDLNKALTTGDFSGFDCTAVPGKPRFVVLLDDDSVIEPDGILNAVSEMMHPVNDCDIMSFKNTIDLRSLKTVYSHRFFRFAGRDGYRENADFYFRLTGRGVFTGKGIYRLEAFREKLEGALPSGCVLSHDIIEGALLNTCASGTAVYESAPESFACDNARTARWTKGDIQLMPLLSFKRADNGKMIKLLPVYAFIILNNALRPLRPAAAACLLAAALFLLNLPIAVIGAVCLAFPFAVRVGASACGGNRRKIYALKEILSESLLFVEEAVLLLFNAVNGICLFFGTLLRMIRGKKLLEWRTFYMSKGDGAAPAIIFFPSLALSAVLCAAAYFASLAGAPSGMFPVYAFAAMFAAEAVYAVFAYKSGKNPRSATDDYAGNTVETQSNAASHSVDDTIGVRTEAAVNLNASDCVRRGRAKVRRSDIAVKRAVSPRVKTALTEYARRTYEYFENEHSDGIIADNFQEAFDVGRRPLTSPTNIGYSILAEISAEKIGLTNYARAESGIIKILEAVDKLEKWNGHLYNWY
ncbi:MAG: hypothetical protein LBC13_01510, partial [Clostridiales bacterium]|nr:hypothetical protein [Clostridiales bacterium]